MNWPTGKPRNFPLSPCQNVFLVFFDNARGIAIAASPVPLKFFWIACCDKIWIPRFVARRYPCMPLTLLVLLPSFCKTHPVLVLLYFHVERESFKHNLESSAILRPQKMAKSQELPVATPLDQLGNPAPPDPLLLLSTPLFHCVLGPSSSISQCSISTPARPWLIMISPGADCIPHGTYGP